MRKLLVVGLAGILFLGGTSVMARDMRGGETVILEREEVVDGDYFAAGERVEVLGTVKGDVYAAGGKVVIDGTVEGDVLVVGGEVTIGGQVDQDVRAAGGNIEIGGIVGGSISFAGGNVDIEKSAKVGRSVVGAGGDVTILGEIGQDVRLATGNSEVEGVVGRNLVAVSESLRLQSGSMVNGDLEYWMKNEVNMAQGASVSGQVIRNELPEEWGGMSREEVGGAAKAAGKTAWGAIKVVGILGFLIIALGVVMVAPNYGRLLAETVEKSPWKSAAVGLVVLIVGPIAAVMAMATVVGFPLGLMALVLYIMALYFAKLPVIVWVGLRTLRAMNMGDSVMKGLVVGLVIYELVGMIPVIGIVMKIMVTVVGLGAIMLGKGQLIGDMRKKKML